MKKLIVKANEIAVSYKNGSIHKVYRAGRHFIGFFETAICYEIGSQYDAPIHAEIALQNIEFLECVDVVIVPEHHIAMQIYNAQFKTLLTTGTYIFFKNVHETTYQVISLLDYKIDPSIDETLLKLPLFNNVIRQFDIAAYEKAILYVDGNLNSILEPGQYKFYKNSTVLHLAKVDMRTTSIELSGQEILSKDKAQLRMNLNAKYKVIDIVKFLNDNKESEKQFYSAIQMATRSVVGRLTIDELMENKESINASILAESAALVKHLGVEVIDCGIKDIILPADIKNILNQVLIAEKRAQANIITRREETASTRSLLNTAKLMEDNTMLWKLKEMEYVEKIAEKINTISLAGNGQIVDQLKTIFVK